VLGLALAAALTSVALLTAGGVDLAPNTWSEIATTVLGVALVAWALVRGAPGRAWGGVTLALLLAVGALTFASIVWSVQPADSWIEANRTLSYVAAFAGAAALARLAPQRWPALLGAVAIAATILSGYGLLAKALPQALDPTDLLGRLSAPFAYWNATGLIAALGLPACLWAGARRERRRATGALSVPAIGILVAALVLSYSRGALLVAVVGLAGWFAVVPLRLRAALVLILGAAGGTAISLWALSRRPFTHDHASLASRIAAGHTFGLVLIAVLGSLTIAGLLAALATDRLAVEPRTRRRVGIVLVTLLALVPLGGIAALAASSRGLSGEVSHVWSTLTNPRSGVGDSPRRLVALGNTRPLYWSEGLKVGEHALLKGTGALGYRTARTRYVHDPLIVVHAHSYVIETFADFGLIGLALNLALLVAWMIAAARAVGARMGPRLRPAARAVRARTGPRQRPAARSSPEPASAAKPTSARSESPSGLTSEHPGRAAERDGLLTLLAVVIVFGLHSAIDWTWFVPGTALPALACAGWLAGRGPLERPIGRSPRPRRPGSDPGAYGGVLALTALALLGAWVIWQPLRSADAGQAAIAALTRGDTGAAIADARTAAARNPVSVQPLRELSAIDTAAGDPAGARAELERAISVQPQNAVTWQALGEFDLERHQPQRALASLQVALRLYSSSSPLLSDLARARSELAAPRVRRAIAPAAAISARAAARSAPRCDRKVRLGAGSPARRAAGARAEAPEAVASRCR